MHARKTPNTPAVHGFWAHNLRSQPRRVGLPYPRLSLSTTRHVRVSGASCMQESQNAGKKECKQACMTEGKKACMHDREQVREVCMETLVVSRVAVMHASGQERMQTSMHDSGKESMHACMYDKEEVVEVCIKTSGKTTVSWQGHRKPPTGPLGGCSTGTPGLHGGGFPAGEPDALRHGRLRGVRAGSDR